MSEHNKYKGKVVSRAEVLKELGDPSTWKEDSLNLMREFSQTPEQKMKNVEELIEKLTKALSFKYPNDKMMPGITISFLKNGNYYVSLVRYCPTKKVIFKTKSENLDRALLNISKQLLMDEQSANPVDALRKTVYSPNPVYPCPDPYCADPLPDPHTEQSDSLKPCDYDDFYDDYSDDNYDEGPF